MKNKVIIVILIFAVLVGLRFAWGKYIEFMNNKMMGAAMTPKVKLDEVQEVEIKHEIQAPGRIVAKYSVDLVARVDGYLQEKRFSEGDFVKKGQVLFVIEPNQYQIALNRAKADLATAEAQAVKAQKDYERAAELVAKDFIAKSTYDDALAQKDVANATVSAARAAVNDATRNYNYTRITSPIDGRIGILNVTQGNYVNAQSGALATVVSTDPIYVTYDVDSKQFASLRDDEIIPQKGQQNPIVVELTLPDGTVYEHKGVEDFWDNKISQSTGTIKLRATFKNPDNKLIAGDFVKVRVYASKVNKKLVVPQDCVLQDTQGRYIYQVDEKNVAQKKYINASKEYEKFWIIDSGLELGEKYISEGAVKVMAQRPVKVLEDEAKEQQEK